MKKKMGPAVAFALASSLRPRKSKLTWGLWSPWPAATELKWGSETAGPLVQASASVCLLCADFDSLPLLAALAQLKTENLACASPRLEKEGECTTCLLIDSVSRASALSMLCDNYFNAFRGHFGLSAVFLLPALPSL